MSEEGKSMNDILGLGKVLPLEKLLGIVSSVVGRVSKSYFDKKDIDTEAYKIRKLAEAKADEMRIISTAAQENSSSSQSIKYENGEIQIASVVGSIDTKNLSLEERTNSRINFQEEKRQLNIESVVSVAAEKLKNEPPVTDEAIDEDWKTRFFNLAQDVSDEDMQSLWGRILAGEVKRPKSYSLRTLELLKSLTKEEAELFEKFAQLKIVSENISFIYNQDNKKNKYLENTFGLSFINRLLMCELGLITSEKNFEFSLTATNQSQSICLLKYGKKGIWLERGQGVPKQPLEVLVFTKIGDELSQLIEPTYRKEYMEKICSHFKIENVKIVCGDLFELNDGQMQLLNPVEYTE
ncbi:MAG: hypothetical protein Ta2A_12700 [Treponemataceae bacterium]|nr:MAG: hypothetical protein Ta2A_12700 [Treponemataceae bacterium]